MSRMQKNRKCKTEGCGKWYATPLWRNDKYVEYCGKCEFEMRHKEAEEIVLDRRIEAALANPYE